MAKKTKKKPVKEKWTICFDTLCTGYAPIITDAGVHNPEGTPVSFETKAAAEKEIKSDPEFYEDCFACPMSEIGHKTIYTGKDQ